MADLAAPEHNAKRASVASTTSVTKSRPHSAAELYYPAPQGSPDAPIISRGPSMREGPQIIDASRNAIHVEDEPVHRGSSRGKKRASYQSTGESSTTAATPEGARRSKRNSRQQPVLDDFTLSEYPGLGNLTEITALAAVRPRDDEDYYQDDSLLGRPHSSYDSKRGKRASRSSNQRPLSGSTAGRNRHSHRSSLLPPGDNEDVIGEEENPSEIANPAPISRSSNRSRYRNTSAEGDAWQDQEGELEQEKGPPPAKQTPFEKVMQQVFTLSYLVFFSILGVLARLGMQWLTFYPGAPVITGVLWANFAGSLFMGFLTEDRVLFREHPSSKNRSQRSHIRRASIMTADRFTAFHKSRKTVPLYVGLTTGFCGSFTSFSSFVRDTFLALSNDLQAPYNQPPTSYNAGAGPAYFHAQGPPTGREGGYSFMALVAVIILTVGISLFALRTGAHLALATERIPYVGALAPSFLFTGKPRALLDWLMPLLAIGSWLGAVFMAIWPPDRPEGPSSRGSWADETWRGEAIFACVFAPLGCLTRYYASVHLNLLQPAFPLGTFAANVFGSAVEGMAWDIQHVPLRGAMRLVGGGRVGCQVLQGIMDGYCGALTTVSTWVVELNSLKTRHAWFYGSMSVGVSLALWIIIVGSVRWTIGFSDVACTT